MPKHPAEGATGQNLQCLSKLCRNIEIETPNKTYKNKQLELRNVLPLNGIRILKCSTLLGGFWDLYYIRILNFPLIQRFHKSATQKSYTTWKGSVAIATPRECVSLSWPLWLDRNKKSHLSINITLVAG